jgi:predicted  nucleic acid-binding Zn ribbon protein
MQHVFTADYMFVPQKASPKAREKLVDSVYSLLGSLLKNGQIYGREIMVWQDGALHLYCDVPRPDSLSVEHFSEWGKGDYEKLLLMLTAPPTYRILDDGPIPKRFPTWQSAPSLYLFTHFLDITSPVCAEPSGAPLPLYTLPLSDTRKQDIVFWQNAYKATDELWIGSRDLEMPAYRQLVEPGSGLSERGRAICRDIEAATKKPTFYYLSRYYGREEGEAERLCPGCGEPWATGVQHTRFFDFEFRCEPCRLVSHQGVDTSDMRHARIGEWRS